MQASNEEQKQNLIQLALTAEDFHVAGFSKKYAAYLDGQAGGGVYNGGLLLIVGFIIGAVGVATLILGPSTIYYDRLSGPPCFSTSRCTQVPSQR
ncbi:hypothetical protein D3C77_365470 [compost metagenome]